MVHTVQGRQKCPTCLFPPFLQNGYIQVKSTVVVYGFLILTLAVGFSSSGDTSVSTHGGTASLNFAIDFNGYQSEPPYFLIQREFENRPFCVNGVIDNKFVNPGKYSVVSERLGNRLLVNLSIESVNIKDEGVYILNLPLSNKSYSQLLEILIPPGPLNCHPIITGEEKKRVEMHCEAKSGSVSSTISCFQNGVKLPNTRNRPIQDNGLRIEGNFRYTPLSPVRCCTHDVTTVINGSVCEDYMWPPTGSHSTAVPKHTHLHENHWDDEFVVATVLTEILEPKSELFAYGQNSGSTAKPVTVLMIFTFIIKYII